jgi:hypothetical protein
MARPLRCRLERAYERSSTGGQFYNVPKPPRWLVIRGHPSHACLVRIGTPGKALFSSLTVAWCVPPASCKAGMPGTSSFAAEVGG